MYKIALSEARVGMVLAETVMSALNDAPFLAGHLTKAQMAAADRR